MYPVSKDRRQWELLSWVNPTTVDDRNMILFPEKINGRYMLLRRPTSFVSTDTSHGAEHPTIRFSLSDDLKNWTEPQVLTTPQFAWEDNRIGASTPPIRTEHGWLLLYHGVQNVYPPTRRVVYRLGAMLLDLADPTRVIARCPHYIMEPETYYENCGLIIPHVIFPTGAVVKDGLLYIYYGACDTSIALATVPLEDLLAHVLKFPVD